MDDAARGGTAVPGPATVAARLDRLFTMVTRPDGSEFSYREVAEAIAAAGGPTISASYIWQLRTGGKDNPTKKHMEALATFFGVPAGYFLQAEAEAEAVEAEVGLLKAMRDAGVRDVALRVSGLSPVSLEVIREVIERTRTLEGLDHRRRPGVPDGSQG